MHDLSLYLVIRDEETSVIDPSGADSRLFLQGDHLHAHLLDQLQPDQRVKPQLK